MLSRNALELQHMIPDQAHDDVRFLQQDETTQPNQQQSVALQGVNAPMDVASFLDQGSGESRRAAAKELKRMEDQKGSTVALEEDHAQMARKTNFLLQDSARYLKDLDATIELDNVLKAALRRAKAQTAFDASLLQQQHASAGDPAGAAGAAAVAP